MVLHLFPRTEDGWNKRSHDKLWHRRRRKPRQPNSARVPFVHGVRILHVGSMGVAGSLLVSSPRAPPRLRHGLTAERLDIA